MALTFNPALEADADDNGEILYNEEELKNVKIFVDGEYLSERITRKDILDFGDEGFLLQNVLSSTECKYYIAEAERVGFEKIHGARDHYRSSQRSSLRS